jgi:hypothetical protein
LSSFFTFLVFYSEWLNRPFDTPPEPAADPQLTLDSILPATHQPVFNT